MRLRGRVALVSGATSGIGRATALLLAEEGAQVAFTGRRAERLRELEAEIARSGGQALGIAADVTREEDGRRAVAATVERFGRLNVLVNNAGVLGPGGLLDVTPEEWDRQMSVNLRGLFLLTRAAAPELIRARGNSIVNVSSVTGMRPYGGLLPYCVSKAGVDMFTRCASLDLASHGVRVNAVNPGVVVTELHTVTRAIADYPGFLERSRTTHPIGFVGEPRDVAQAILWLVSDESRWVTGTCLSVDGGRANSSAR